MTPLTAEREEALKEQFREVFYAGMLRKVAEANQEPMATMIDFVRGRHSLQDVIYGVPPIPDAVKPLIYPLRTYELIHELKSKGE